MLKSFETLRTSIGYRNQSTEMSLKFWSLHSLFATLIVPDCALQLNLVYNPLSYNFLSTDASGDLVSHMITCAMAWCDGYTAPLLVPLNGWLQPPLPLQIKSKIALMFLNSDVAFLIMHEFTKSVMISVRY